MRAWLAEWVSLRTVNVKDKRLPLSLLGYAWDTLSDSSTVSWTKLVIPRKCKDQQPPSRSTNIHPDWSVYWAKVQEQWRDCG